MLQHYRLLLPLIFALLTLSQLAAQTPVACGDVLSSPGIYVLTTNLSCNLPIFINSDNVSLDFQGHTLANATPGTHIAGVITAMGAFPGSTATTTNGVRIYGGTITGFGSAIVIGGPIFSGAPRTTAAEVHHMTLTGNERGIIVGYATGVSLHNNTITNTVTALAQGNGQGTGIAAFSLLDSQIRNNAISGSTYDGIQVWGGSNDNMIMNNDVTANARGIVTNFPSTGNVIKKNQAMSNTVVDLLDLNPGCDSNIWKNNTFGTSSPSGCIN